MPLWFPTSRPSAGQGKFIRQRATGLRSAAGSNYRDWTIQFVQHSSSGGLTRSRFHAIVFDPHGIRRAYLQGFSSLRQAAAAARTWVDDAERSLVPADDDIDAAAAELL